MEFGIERISGLLLSTNSWSFFHIFERQLQLSSTKCRKHSTLAGALAFSPGNLTVTQVGGEEYNRNPSPGLSQINEECS